MNAMPGRLPLHILVIEDDADTCENLRDILELDGHTVTFALSAADAMQHPHLSDVDVVLLDWKLPDATALELLPRIKESAVQAEVIIVTGHSDFEMAVSALRQGAADYLLKPINPQALRTSLQRIAEQQRLAQEKAESDAMFRGLVEAAPVLIVIVRPDLTIEYFSPFAEQLTGYRAEEIRHANFGTVFLTEPHRDEATEIVAQMLQGQPVEGYENTIRCADGTIRWMVWNARLLTNLHGAPAILAIGQDVTEHKAAIERLVQSERLAAIGEAMTGLAHESRNALQRSQAFLELLSLEVGAQPDALKLVGQIQEAQNHLHQLYEEVREYAAPLKPNRRVQSPAPAKGKAAQPDLNQLLAETLDLGIEQADLLIKRSKLDAAVAVAALPAAESEPLLQLCRAHDLKADDLLGWTYYAMGVFQRIAHYRGIEKEYNQRLDQAHEEHKGKGLMSVLGGNREPVIPPLDPNVGRILQAARRELQTIEPQLTELYWSLYEDLAWLLCRPEETNDATGKRRSRPTPQETATIRACLRYGLVSSHPGLLRRDLAEFIRADCTDDVHVWSNTPDITNVVYADEYIEGIAARKLTVSPDEDLELNNRNSPQWRADRVWRQAVITQVRRELIETRLSGLQRASAEMHKLVEQKEESYRTLRADGKKNEATAVSQELITTKAQASRLAKAAEQIDRILLGKVRDQAVESAGKLLNEERVLDLEAVVRREARFIRRTARLAARLKEPFPQFALRDFFEPLRPDHHSRKAVLDEIAGIERADRHIFHQVLLPNKKADRRISVRMSPTFLISPCRGQMAFSFCERRWDDNGRLVLPLLAQRQGSLPDMLLNMLADFRWDCSKEEAGMDWIVADALCAGYAAVRWAVRKLPEKAQKMMGIDPKLKDKPNWRTHYRLFVTSTKEAGRLLFNKSDEVYKIAVKYIGLPPGVEALRRD